MSARQDARAPLPERVRPASLDEVVGQETILAAGGTVRADLAARRLSSIVLWGPPGCGKTTVARLLAEELGWRMATLSAVLDGVKELRAALDTAEAQFRMGARRTLLFVDEVHRWNRAQQDALLPHLEAGTVVLVGATTEHPGPSLTPALRSRLRIIPLAPLEPSAIEGLLSRALAHPDGLAGRMAVAPEALAVIAAWCGGDARKALMDLEWLTARFVGQTLTAELVRQALGRPHQRHDKAGNDHYDALSAMIKSMRGSDPDAAIYWLARLIDGGEPVELIARRIVVFAAEDVGNADPRGLQVAVSAAQAAAMVGWPEARIPLAQAVTWLASCPKSNASYLAIDRALAEVKRSGALPVPIHLRNPFDAVTREMGHGEGYLYPHDHPHRVVAQSYWPPGMAPLALYEPADHGEEKTVKARLAWWAARRRGEP